MDTPHVDPFAPWLGAEDLELLQDFHTATPGSPVSHGASVYQPQHHVSQPSFQFISPHNPLVHNGDELYHGHQHPHRQHRTVSSPTYGQSFTALMAAQPLPAKRVTRRPSTSSSSSSSKASVPSSRRSSSKLSASASSPPDSPHNSGEDVVLDEANMTPEELRREKNRQKVRRHYYRKLNHLNSLRSEVEQLEGKFQNLLKQNETSHAVVTTLQLQQHTQLMETLEVSRSALEVENEQLRRQFMTQQSQYMELRRMFTAENALFMTSPIAKAGFIKPLSLEECYAVRDRAVAEVMMLTGRARRPQRGVGIAGWQDNVAVVDGFWKFSIHKTFRNLSPTSVCDRTWPMLTDPSAFSRLYSPAVEAKCVVVQQVDDRNIVLFQECRAMDTNNKHILMKSLFLASRVETPTGELTVIRGLGEDRLCDRDLFLPTSGEFAGQVVWHDLFSWAKYDRAGLYGEDCEIEFGGSAPTVGDNKAFWSVEILNFVVRWESAIYGPPILVTSADDTSSTGNHRLESEEAPKARTPPVEVP